MAHPFHDVAVVGAYNTVQARQLEGHDSLSIAVDGALGVLADAGLDRRDVDGVVGERAGELVYELGIGPVTRGGNGLGIPAVIEAAEMIASGQCRVVLITAGSAGIYTQHASTAPWTRPGNEFVAPFGMFTAAEFALMARRHMLRFGTTTEQMATVAATIRNHGSINPEAVYFGRGPYSPQDILDSRPVAEPFHLLDCSTTSEGGCGILLASADRGADLRQPPVYVLGGGSDSYGGSYQHPPVWDLPGTGEIEAGYVGRRAARAAFAAAGLGPSDVDVCEFYDPFSFEIIRQFEAFGFCGDGEGGPFVMDGRIALDGEFPVTTDGGTMSFAHPGASTQMLQRVIRGVHQLRGSGGPGQVDGAAVALCSNGGSGALFNDVLLLGVARP